MAFVKHPPKHSGPSSPPAPQVDVTEPTVKKLLGPRGEVLRTWSDRPPVGFHQGTKDH